MSSFSERVAVIRLRHRIIDKGPHGPWARLRNTFMVRRWRERGVWIIAAATFLYLMLEFSFNSWLLDKMSESTIYGLDAIEVQGRLLSGFAVALLFWPFLLSRENNRTRAFLTTLGTTALVMTLVYQGERYLIDRLVEQSSAERRAAAVTSSLLRQGLASGSVDSELFEGMWDEATASSITGKVFIGVVAYLAAGSTTALQQTTASAEPLMRNVIEKQTGGVDLEYERFIESQRMVRVNYDMDYLGGLKQYRAELQKVPAKADQLWEQYLDRLQAQNSAWGRARIGGPYRGELVPGFVAPRVRSEVRKMGLEVKDSWRTGDKGTFIRLAENKFRKEMQDRLQQKLDGLPTGLSLSEFVAQPVVQRRWREKLGYADNVTGLSLAEVSRDAFERRYYQPALAGRASEGVKKYAYAIDEYRDGGPRAKEGKKAYEAMIASVFALTLSLLGALVHGVKSALLCVQLRNGWRFRSPLIKAGFLMGAVILILLMARALVTTNLTSHTTYRTWLQADAEQVIEKVVLDAVIKTQTFAHPVFSVPYSIQNAISSLVNSRERAKRLERQAANSVGSQ